MKKALITLFSISFLLVSCFEGKPSSAQSDGNIDAMDSISGIDAENCTESNIDADGEIEVSMTGSISPDTWTAGEEATVTIARIPKTITGFEQIRSKIGGTPQGAVALQLIAFEMYNQNTEVGTECVKMNNTDINVPSVMRRLPEIFGKHSLDDSYPRKHLVATYFEGATPENGFNPTKPYTVRVRTNKVHKYERSESLKGYVLYLDVYSSGYDTSWRGCEVVKQKGNDYYTVSNSPSMYVQCKEVPFDANDDYKGLS